MKVYSTAGVKCIFLDIMSNNMREDGRDFHLTVYVLTHIMDKKGFELKDINTESHKYHI